MRGGSRVPEQQDQSSPHSFGDLNPRAPPLPSGSRTAATRRRGASEPTLQERNARVPES